MKGKFLMTELQRQSLDMSDEQALVRSATPYLESAFRHYKNAVRQLFPQDEVAPVVAPSLVMVNTERKFWLQVSDAKSLAPDITVLHQCAVNDGYPQWALRDSVVTLFEAKLIVEPSSLGEVRRRVQNLRRLDNNALLTSPECDTCSVVLFDNQQLQLYRMDDSLLYEWDEISWTSEVALPALCAFLHRATHRISSWTLALEEALRSLKVSLDASKPFLGKGAYGRVFRVIGASTPATPIPVASATAASAVQGKPADCVNATSGKPETFALKLVMDHRTLATEIGRLVASRKHIEEKHRHKGYLLPVYSQSCTLTVRNPANPALAIQARAALFTPVGDSLSSAKRLKALWTASSAALYDLHKCGVAHLDARIHNLVKIKYSPPMQPEVPGAAAASTRPQTRQAAAKHPKMETKFMWIDLSALMEGSLSLMSEHFDYDCQTFIASFFRIPKSDRSVVKLTKEYSRLLTVDQSLPVEVSDSKSDVDASDVQSSVGRQLGEAAFSLWQQRVWEDLRDILKVCVSGSAKLGITLESMSACDCRARVRQLSTARNLRYGCLLPVAFGSQVTYNFAGGDCVGGHCLTFCSWTPGFTYVTCFVIGVFKNLDRGCRRSQWMRSRPRMRETVCVLGVSSVMPYQVGHDGAPISLIGIMQFIETASGNNK